MTVKELIAELATYNGDAKVSVGEWASALGIKGVTSPKEVILKRLGLPNLTDSILEEAARIRSGERNADYGDAVESFEIIARVANAITGLELTPAQCCKVMLAVKLTRERYNHKRDNLVDMCGYADILNLIEEQPINDKKR